MREIRQSVRSLLRTPSFAVVAVLTLALGIGATTAVFSTVNAILLRDLPYAEPDRLVRVYNRWEGTDRGAVSPAEYFDYADSPGGFEALGAFAEGSLNITGGERAERVPAAFVDGRLFRTLGVRAVRGRTILPEDDRPGLATTVAVLSHGLWVRRYGADPGVVGRSIALDGTAATVVGVLPPAFRLPGAFGVGEAADVYVPMGLDRAAVTERGSHFIGMVGRLAPGVPVARAQSSLGAVADRFVAAFPDDYPRDMGFRVELVPLREDVVGAIRPLLLVLLGAVAFVLLIACANVSALMLMRVEDRRRELSVRAAMGAGRGRLARHLLIDGLVLAAIGGVLGVLLAVWGVEGLIALQPGDIPRIDEVAVDGRVLLFGLATTLGAGIVFGLAPLLAWPDDVFSALREGGRGGSPGRASERLRRVLIAGEFAAAIVLLAGAGLLLRSFGALLDVDPGYRTEGVLTTRLSLPAGYEDDAAVRLFYEQLTRRVREIPGVLAAGASSHIPLAHRKGDINIQVEGREKLEGEVSPRMDWQVVTPGFFEAMGYRLLRGRALQPSDRADAPGAVVINEAAAAEHFPGEDPLGRRFLLGGEAGPGWVTVVGIVADGRHGSLAEPPPAEMFIPHAQFTFWHGGSAVSTMSIAALTRGEPAAAAPAVREAVRAMDADVALEPFVTMDQVASDSVARPRFALSLIGFFALVALVLAAIGVYGLVAYSASRRTHEIGIRLALGARPDEVASLLLRQGLVLAALGTALGLPLALLLSRNLADLLYDVGPRDPLALASGVLVLAASAALASWLPARRAARADVAGTLRAD